MPVSARPRARMPAIPRRQCSFTDFQIANPMAPPPGDRLDGEYDRINKSIEAILAWASVSLNSDGSLRDALPPSTPADPVARSLVPVGSSDPGLAQDWSQVSYEWAEHMPDTIPPNILAWMGITGDHWSSRWWANHAAQIIQDFIHNLYGTVDEFLYLPSAPTTVFTGTDYHGNVLALNPAASETAVYLNGVKLLEGLDYSLSSTAVTMLLGTVTAPNTVEILNMKSGIGVPGPIGPAGPAGPPGPPAGAGTFIESTGTAVTLADGTPANLASLALTAGDWAITGAVSFNAGTALISTLLAGSGTVSATVPPLFYYSQISPGGALSGGQWCLSIPERRLALSTPTTVYLVAQAGFGPGSTVTGTGHFQARGYT